MVNALRIVEESIELYVEDSTDEIRQSTERGPQLLYREIVLVPRVSGPQFPTCPGRKLEYMIPDEKFCLNNTEGREKVNALAI